MNPSNLPHLEGSPSCLELSQRSPPHSPQQRHIHHPFIHNDLGVERSLSDDDDPAEPKRAPVDDQFRAGSHAGVAEKEELSGLRGFRGYLFLLFVSFLVVFVLVEILLTCLLISALGLTPSGGFPAFLIADNWEA